MVRVLLGLSATIAVGLALAGCKQHKFLTESDFHYYRTHALGPVGDCDPEVTIDPMFEMNSISTVNNPEGERRPISLAECIAIALENGRTGGFLDQAAGNRNLGPPSGVTDSIRVFAYDPAIQAADIEQSLAKFDTQWSSSVVWSKADRPVGTALDTFQAGLINEIQQDSAQFQTQLLKPLPTGGVAGITFNTSYDFSNLQQRVNPAYRPSLEFSIEQPLLRGGGVGINQLRDNHPGSLQNQLSTFSQVPGILLTRIFADEAKLDFERRVHELLFSVEQAYWQLYCAYYDLYSRETAYKQAQAAWGIAKVRFDAGSIPTQELEQVRQQLETFRVQRLQALGNGTGLFPGVLEAERRLRYIIGLSPEDGYRLIPTDTPVTSPYQPDGPSALQTAMARRPDLMQDRLEIRANQLAVLREKDELLPDIRVFATHDTNAIGSQLDGDGPNSALRNLSENSFNSWNVGVQGNYIIGARAAHTEVKKAQMRLAQQFALLRDHEWRVRYSLEKSIRDIAQFATEVKIQRARRDAASKELESRYQLFLAGSADSTIDVLLQAQRNWADALRDEYFSICQYNIALIDFERQRGTIMEHNNVTIMDGPLPACAQARASEHIRERDRAILVKIAKDCAPLEGELRVPYEQLAAERGALPAVNQEEQRLLKELVENRPFVPADPAPLPVLLGDDAALVPQDMEKDIQQLSGPEQVEPNRESLESPERPVEQEPTEVILPMSYEAPGSTTVPARPTLPPLPPVVKNPIDSELEQDIENLEDSASPSNDISLSRPVGVNSDVTFNQSRPPQMGWRDHPISDLSRPMERASIRSPLTTMIGPPR